MQSLAGTLALMTKLIMVAVLLTGTPGYAFIRKTTWEEVCDTTGSQCTLVRETVESERDTSSPDVLFGGSNQRRKQNDQSVRDKNPLDFNSNESKRSLNQQYYRSYPFVNPSSLLNDQSERVSKQPVFQDYGSKWDQLRTRKALQAATQIEQWLQKRTRGRTEGFI